MLFIFTINFAYLTTACANIEKSVNFIEYFNELCTICVLHLMLFFVQTVPLSPLERWNGGSSVMAILSVMFGINFIYLITTTIRNLCLIAKLRKMK